MYSYELNFVTPNLYVEALTHSIMEINCIWRKIFKEMRRLKWSHWGWLNLIWLVISLEEIRAHTQEKPGQYKGRTQSSISQEGRPKKKLILPTLDLRFLASIIIRKYTSIVYMHVVLHGRSPRKLIHVLKQHPYRRTV